MKAYLNIGTNLGNKTENIETAISLIEKALGCNATRSEIIESEPWGFTSSNSFLNIGIALDTAMQPLELLGTLKAIEKEMGSASHRTANGDYADRLIDIDIMDIENIRMTTPTLTIPHPHLQSRTFFLTPYTQLKTK